jgi:peptidoglycan/LPS O-acetylase OafA/YrhL
MSQPAGRKQVERGQIPACKSGPVKRIDLLDFVRALAIIHIIMYHYYLEWFKGSFLVVPEGILANLPRLEVFKDGGIFGAVKNIFSFLFAYGFTSVNLFLLLSGFVLTYSLLVRSGKGEKNKWRVFLWKRFKRVLVPFYISVVIGIGFLYLRNAVFPALGGAPMYGIWDCLKLLFVPFAFYDIQFLQLFNGDYWFVPLILQLYLIFPILYLLLKKTGPWKFLAGAFIVTVLYRFIAAYFLDSVPMGVIYPSANSYRLFSFFLPRLFEFGLGMALAYWHFNKARFLERVTCHICAAAGLVFSFSGFILNMYRWGWAFSDLCVAGGLFFLFLGIAKKFDGRRARGRIMKTISGASYEIFLLHHYFLNYFLMPLIVTMGIKNETGFWLLMPVFFVVAVLIGEAGRRLSVLAAPK